MCGDMVGQAIAEQDQVGYSMLMKELVEKDRPIRIAPAELMTRVWPVIAVAAGEIDPVHRMTLRGQRPAKLSEKGPRRPLQENERTRARHLASLASCRFARPC